MPDERLGIIVVIPCCNEPHLVEALAALARCEPPECAVEVIVVINAAADAPPTVIRQNRRTWEEARIWLAGTQLNVYLIQHSDLPPKKAGVGLARKIGMDEAVRRFDAVRRLNGVVACFDADCVCDPNYFVELEEFFREHPKAPGCSIYFEHPLEGSEPAGIYEAITQYELHLRYYVEALRYSGFPHAFQTVGSSMAVRADVYVKQGGMNKRQAGEDFYFLHKVIPLGHFGEVNTTRIIPSPRPSDRVPFGTGRAVRAFLSEGRLASYPLQAFEDLRVFFDQVDLTMPPEIAVPEVLDRFLREQGFADRLSEMKAHSASAESFRKRFFRWFDGFLAMKYIHYARDQLHGSAEVASVSRALLQKRNCAFGGDLNALDLLLFYRRLQRERDSVILAGT